MSTYACVFLMHKTRLPLGPPEALYEGVAADADVDAFREANVASRGFSPKRRTRADLRLLLVTEGSGVVVELVEVVGAAVVVVELLVLVGAGVELLLLEVVSAVLLLLASAAVML